MTFDPVLTTQQFNILIRLANGGSHITTAKELGVSRDVVKNEALKVCQELGAETIPQAVAIAFCCDILSNRDIKGFGAPAQKAAR
jgi:DNA-binding CsgD family transcriptional regulator